MNYHHPLLKELGPMPTFAQVGEFLEMPYQKLYVLVKQGKLETIQTSKRKRICLNSLLEYLQAEVGKLKRKETRQFRQLAGCFKEPKVSSRLEREGAK